MKRLSQECLETGSFVVACSKHEWAGAQQQVEALLTYLIHTDRKPFAHTYQPPAGTARRSDADAIHTVTIRNARHCGFSIDKEGFELVKFPTNVRDFYDDEEVKSLYYPEIVQRLKQLTGGTVIVSNHVVRNAGNTVHEKSSVQGASLRVHNDYTVRSAPQRVRDLLEKAEAERLLRYRLAAINVWRTIRGPVKNMPLALCDAQSVELSDLVATDLILRDRVSETYRLTHNPNHRWYYFPDMQPDEAILIKCYDSDNGRAKFTPHAAFDDPTTPPEAPPRESIEVRALVFFEACTNPMWQPGERSDLS
jgi:hypothetical protein